MESMNTQWFEDILGRKFHSTVKVLSVLHGEGLEKGENYGSSTGRLTLELQLTSDDGSSSAKHQQLKLFAKYPPSAKAHREFINKYNIFEREAFVYNELLPAMEELAKESEAPAHFRIPYPEAYYAGESPNDSSSMVLLLEDLTALGFRMGNRKTGLDRKETAVVMRAFARFHAHSYALKEASGLSDKDFKARFKTLGEHDILSTESIKPLFAQQGSAERMAAAFARKLVNDADAGEENCQLAAGLPKPEREDLVARLIAYAHQENLPGRIDALLERKGLTCFALGDCWVNNMMFRYENDEKDGSNKEPAEVRLLDFQVVRFTPITMDIANFWYTSTSREVFVSIDEYLRIYYDEFIACLQALKSSLTPDKFSFEDLKADFCRFEEFGFLLSISGLPVLVITKDDFPDDFGKGFAEDFSRLINTALNGPLGEKVLLRFKDHAMRALKQGII